MPAYMTDAGMRHDEGVRVRQVIVDAMLDVAHSEELAHGAALLLQHVLHLLRQFRGHGEVADEGHDGRPQV